MNIIDDAKKEKLEAIIREAPSLIADALPSKQTRPDPFIQFISEPLMPLTKMKRGGN